MFKKSGCEVGTGFSTFRGEHKKRKQLRIIVGYKIKMGKLLREANETRRARRFSIHPALHMRRYCVCAYINT
jgi:hypothetical protein